MTIKQKRAIGYAVRARAERRRRDFIIDKEGNLQNFNNSKYKTMFYYIVAVYGVRVY